MKHESHRIGRQDHSPTSIARVRVMFLPGPTGYSPRVLQVGFLCQWILGGSAGVGKDRKGCFPDLMTPIAGGQLPDDPHLRQDINVPEQAVTEELDPNKQAASTAALNARQQVPGRAQWISTVKASTRNPRRMERHRHRRKAEAPVPG